MEQNGSVIQISPLDTINNVTAAINQGDLAGMIEFFDHDAILVVPPLAGQPGQMARGIAAISEAYESFIAMRPVLHRIAQHVIETGDLALHTSRWTLTATTAEGRKVESTATSADVLRRQADGRWLVVIYNPYGTALIER